jgi:hypothetical protein
MLWTEEIDPFPTFALSSETSDSDTSKESIRMTNTTLFRWGGIAAWAYVVVQGASYVSGWVTGGIEFTAFVPLFSSGLACLLVATVAGYGYLVRSHSAFAKFGLAFAVLAITFMFLEAAVWASRDAGDPASEATMMALFGALHLIVLWMVALWYGCWGIGFVQLTGTAKTTGVTMIVLSVLNMLNYIFEQSGATGVLVTAQSYAGPVTLLAINVLLGRELLSSSRGGA